MVAKMNKLSVLIVDDVPANLLLFKRQLNSFDLNILEASSGEEALSLLEQYDDIALILMDLQMPEMDGFKLVKRIRASDKSKDIPMIFITGTGDDAEQIAKGHEVGTVDFMMKPLYKDILESEVRVFCDLCQKGTLIQEQLKEIQQQKHKLENEIHKRQLASEALVESEMRYRALVELSPNAVAVQVGDKITYMNATFLRLLGVPGISKLDASSISAFLHPDCREQVEVCLTQIQRQGGSAEPVEARLVRQDGEVSHVVIRASCILYEGEVGALVTLQDITECKLLEEELRTLSFRDALTGLPNRRMFDNQLNREWECARREARPLAVILADIDMFKSYNDNYGHTEGDECLRRMALPLTSAVRRPGDFVARYGGEEFVAILSETDADGAVNIAERMRAAVETAAIEHAYSKVAEVVTVSVGVASLVPTADMQHSNIVEAADQALYEAKKMGRNQVRLSSNT